MRTFVMRLLEDMAVVMASNLAFVLCPESQGNTDERRRQ